MFDINFGFSWVACVAVFVQFAITAVFFFATRRKQIESVGLGIIGIIELVLRAVFVAVLVFFVSNKEIDFNSVIFYVSCGALFIFAVFNAFYYLKNTKVLSAVINAVLLVSYYILVSIWLMNMLAVILISVFALLHIIIALSAALQDKRLRPF